MRRIIKPSKGTVEAILSGKEHICYQYVNWWLYQKGSDEIILSIDSSSELYQWCWKNKDVIVAEMKEMVGAKSPEEKYDWYRRTTRSLLCTTQASDYSSYLVAACRTQDNQYVTNITHIL